jgi:hypothetical protein
MQQLIACACGMTYGIGRCTSAHLAQCMAFARQLHAVSSSPRHHAAPAQQHKHSHAAAPQHRRWQALVGLLRLQCKPGPPCSGALPVRSIGPHQSLCSWLPSLPQVVLPSKNAHDAPRDEPGSSSAAAAGAEGGAEVSEVRRAQVGVWQCKARARHGAGKLESRKTQQQQQQQQQRQQLDLPRQPDWRWQ